MAPSPERFGSSRLTRSTEKLLPVEIARRPHVQQPTLTLFTCPQAAAS
jgi:hypothetical protein